MMKRYIHIASMLCTMFFFASCKKETNITVTLFNPALNEYVSNATIVLNEIKSSGCTEIASALTDANGTAVFSKENLHTSSSCKYKLGIKDSWGIAHQDPCSSQTQNYLNVGGTNNVQLSDYLEIEYRVRCNNTLNPSISGDSLTCSVSPMVYYDPVYNITQGGGGGQYVNFTYDLNYPVASVYTSPSIKIFANRLVVNTRKRKMGIVSTTVDTVRAYPSNGVTIVTINW